MLYSSANTRSYRHPEPGIVSKLQIRGADHNTDIHTDPDREHRVGGIPLCESGCLYTLEVEIHLVNERKHRRSKWRDKLGISRCTPARKVVRVYGAGVELSDIIADPVRASGSGPAWESRVTERVR